MNKELNQIYRIIAQREGITVTADTSGDVSKAEAKEIAVKEVLMGADKVPSYQHFITLPITTQDRWDQGFINFCPRCGANISDHQHENYANFECHECDASIRARVFNFGEEDDSDEN